jgi:hypothetical protein
MHAWRLDVHPILYSAIQESAAWCGTSDTLQLGCSASGSAPAVVPATFNWPPDLLAPCLPFKSHTCCLMLWHMFQRASCPLPMTSSPPGSQHSASHARLHTSSQAPPSVGQARSPAPPLQVRARTHVHPHTLLQSLPQGQQALVGHPRLQSSTSTQATHSWRPRAFSQSSSCQPLLSR